MENESGNFSAAESGGSKSMISRRKLLTAAGLAGIAMAAESMIGPGRSMAAALKNEALTVTELKAASTSGLTANETILVYGYAAVNDGGAGIFCWDAGSTLSDNGGTVILPADHIGAGRWIRIKDGPVSVKCFGAKGDWNGTSGTDDTAALQAAIAAEANLYFPPGLYKITSSLIVARDGTTLEFADPISARLIKLFNGYAIQLSGSYCTFRNMCIDGKGADYSGGYMKYTVAGFNTWVQNARMYDARDAGILFNADAGIFSKFEDSYICTWTNNDTNLNIPSFQSAGTDTKPMHRHLSQIDTGGVVLADLTGMETTLITGCTANNLKFATSTKKAIVTGCRFTTRGNPLTVQGLENSLTGNIIAGDLVLDASCVNNAISGNITAGKLVINADRWKNSFMHRSWTDGHHADCSGVKQMIANWATTSPITAASTADAPLPGPNYLPLRSTSSITGLIARAVSGTITAGSVTVKLLVNNSPAGLSVVFNTASAASGYAAQFFDAGANPVWGAGFYSMTWSTSADYSGSLQLIAGFECES